MEQASRIYVAGEETLIGGAIRRALERAGYRHPVSEPGRDFARTDGAAVEAFFAETKPEVVFLAAGKYGGILANQRYPADLMLDNLLTACQAIRGAHAHGVRKLLYLASSCCYPKHCPQPMRETALLIGPLEPTNEAYALAKLAGIKLCEAYRTQHGANFITAIPTNYYGPGDHFDPEDSHVIGALICKMHRAKQRGDAAVTLWGTGNARREFLFADDIAAACLFLMETYDAPEPVNISGGEEVSIRELAEAIREVVGYPGELRFDTDKPDGMPLKRLDSSRIAALGWRPKTSLRAGLEATYRGFKIQQDLQDLQD